MADEALRYLRILSRVGEAVAGSGGYPTRLERVARVVVPEVADWCIVDVVEDDGAVRRSCVVHAAPEEAALATALREAHPPDAARPVSAALTTGRTEAVHAVDEAWLDARARDPAHRDLLRALGLRSFVCVPLVLEGRPLGAMSFGTSRSGRTYDDVHVALFEEVAARALAAILHARLADEAARRLDGRSRAEEALRRSEDRYRQLIGTLASIVWSADVDGSFVTEQAAWLRYTGQAWPAQGGFGYLDAVHPDDRERVASTWRAAVAARRDYRTTGRLWHAPSQAYHHVEGHAVALRDPDGRVREWIGMVIDVDDRVQAARALERSEERLRMATDTAALGVFEWRAGTKAAVWENDRMYEIFGRTRADGTITRRMLAEQVLEPEDVPAFERALAEALRPDGVFRLTARMRRTSDGAMRWIDVTARFEMAPDGSPERLVGVLADVTDRRLAEQALSDSERRFRLLADAAPVLIWVNGPDGCEFVNQAYVDFVGLPLESIVGTGWQVAIHPDDMASYLGAYRDATARREPFRARTRLRRADGTYRWIESIGRPRFGNDGALLGHVGSSYDVTETLRVETELRDAARRKDEFIAMLSHELRNPLAPIRNAVHVMRAYGPAPAPLERARAIIDRQVTHMARLVDDLLEVSRITRGNITLQKAAVDLHDVVDDAVETTRPLVEQHQHTLSLALASGPILLDADRARLVQVIGNLLANAAKFTPRGGHITLETERTADGQAVVRVRDTGIGIPRELHERIFEPFAQAEQTLARSQGGLGIGLTLVKRLVEMHGGAVRVESDGGGHGATFALTLPAVAGQMPVTAAPPPREADARRLRVLIVEDNVDAAESFSMLLELAGYPVRAVHHGLEALRLLDAWVPDVAFVDLGLPGLTGFDLAERLRADPRCRRTVLIALTGYGGPDNEAQARAHGFQRHLTKPVDGDVVLALLADLGATFLAPGPRTPVVH